MLGIVKSVFGVERLEITHLKFNRVRSRLRRQVNQFFGCFNPAVVIDARFGNDKRWMPFSYRSSAYMYYFVFHIRQLKNLKVRKLKMVSSSFRCILLFNSFRAYFLNFSWPAYKRRLAMI